MNHLRARIRGAGRTAVVTGLSIVVAVLAVAGAGAVATAAGEPVATTTTLTMRADGTGTVRVTTADGTATANLVDLWVDTTWQQTFAVTNGEASIDIGTQSLGDHRVTVRYRNNAAHAASQASVLWTAPGTVQVPTTTTLRLNADGTGTVKVTADGATPSNPVDLWVDSVFTATLTLANGEAAVNLGTRTPGDHQVTVRYRPSSTSGTSQTTVTWTAPGTVQVPTTTTLALNADGTGTVKVSATVASATALTNKVDVWVDSVWKVALDLTNGEAALAIGPQGPGDHLVTARYRPSSTSGTSQTTITWTAPSTVQVPTTTTLQLNAEGVGSVRVAAADGSATPNKVDVWVDGVWKVALDLTNGEAPISMGTQTPGDHQVTARYRPSSTSGTSQRTILWTAPATVQVPTTTSLQLDAEGVGTVRVVARDGSATPNKVDVWVDGVWKVALDLTDGRAPIALGTQTPGDHQVTARYRPSSTSGTSQTTVTWTAPATVQVPTTTTLDLATDGTGSIRVVAKDGSATPNKVDLWIDSTWYKAFDLYDGRVNFALGAQPGGDHRVTVRYRPSSTSGASQASQPWLVTTADQVATTTSLSVLPDGTATIEVEVADGTPATNPVDLWVEGRPQSTHTLTDGRAVVALGSREGGAVSVKVRYRPSPTQQASTTTALWSVDTSPVPAADACGETIEKSDGVAWTCTFADDFDGSVLDRAKWNVQTIFATGHHDVACYVDSPDNVSVSDGALHLTVRKGESQVCAGQDGLVTPYTSGMVTTAHRWSQQYGRFEARVKSTATSTPGLHEAFWLWPDDRYPEGQGTWPANGEIDIAETYSNFANLAVPFLHTHLDAPGGILSGPDANTNWQCAAQRGEFNTYTLEWSPERVEVFVNGRSCLVNTSGNDAFKKRYIMALTQALGSQTGNTLVAETPIPATMTVDYVRAWS